MTLMCKLVVVGQTVRGWKEAMRVPSSRLGPEGSGCRVLG